MIIKKIEQIGGKESANNGFGPIPWKNEYQYWIYLNPNLGGAYFTISFLFILLFLSFSFFIYFSYIYTPIICLNSPVSRQNPLFSHHFNCTEDLPLLIHATHSFGYYVSSVVRYIVSLLFASLIVARSTSTHYVNYVDSVRIGMTSLADWLRQ